MIQASRQGRIQLLPTPDYDRFRRGEAQYDIDQDPVWHYQAKAQAFDAVAFYQCDHLGTPQELTDMNGEIAWAAEYKAWGYAYDALSKAGRQAGLKQPLRFQGQYYDHETGLHYNRHRYYDPHSGRFVSKDPIGLNGGANLYAYAQSAIMWVDPLGLKKFPMSHPHCQEILKKIKNIEQQLSERYVELAADKHKLPNRIGPGEKLRSTIRGHQTLINQQHSLLNKWQTRLNNDCCDDCNNGSPTPTPVMVPVPVPKPDKQTSSSSRWATASGVLGVAGLVAFCVFGGEAVCAIGAIGAGGLAAAQ